MKPTVKCTVLGDIKVGYGVSLIPENHPGNSYDSDPFLSIKNGLPVFTSDVVKYDKEIRMFETRNTIYVFGE